MILQNSIPSSAARASPNSWSCASDLELLRLLQMEFREQAKRDFGGWSKYIPHVPSARQSEALRLYRTLEVFYGGAAGGGKSDWLLMAALQYVDEPGYSAILLRRTYTDLALPGALMDRAHAWLSGTDAHWNGDKRVWEFPSGATLTFGYLDHENDKYRYQSSEFQFIGFDEVTQFEETQYLYLFSRLRRLAGSTVPLRMRAASSPDGIGFDWVKRRFITEGPGQGICYVPARLEDNPYLDREEYEQSLEKLALGDPLTYQRLREGSWEERQGTDLRREWFEYVAQLPEGVGEQCRAIDTALTTKKQSNHTASVGGAMAHGWLYLVEPYKFRKEIPDVVDWIANQKRLKPRVRFGMAKAAGEIISRQYLTRMGIPIEELAAETVDLRARLAPFISMAARGLVKLVGTKEQWEPFMAEATAFPHGKEDDLLAACADLMQMHGLVVLPPAIPVPQRRPQDPYKRAYGRQ